MSFERFLGRFKVNVNLPKQMFQMALFLLKDSPDNFSL